MSMAQAGATAYLLMEVELPWPGVAPVEVASLASCRRGVGRLASLQELAWCHLVGRLASLVDLALRRLVVCLMGRRASSAWCAACSAKAPVGWSCQASSVDQVCLAAAVMVVPRHYQLLQAVPQEHQQIVEAPLQVHYQAPAACSYPEGLWPLVAAAQPQAQPQAQLQAQSRVQLRAWPVEVLPNLVARRQV